MWGDSLIAHAGDRILINPGGSSSLGSRFQLRVPIKSVRRNKLLIFRILQID